jgi:hypothetical protein
MQALQKIGSRLGPSYHAFVRWHIWKTGRVLRRGSNGDIENRPTMNRKQRRATAAASRQGRGDAPPVASPAEQLHRAVVDSSRARAASTLAQGRSPDHVARVVDGGISLGAAYMAQSPTSPSDMACKQGCAFCCHRPVGTSAPSVFRVAAWLREALAPVELEGVLARLVALDAKTHGTTWTVRDRPPYACALLVDGACSVYEVRPFVCRGWSSADADSCRRGLEHDGVEMRYDLFQRTTYGGVEKGIQLALADAGLDAGDLELTAALRVALENPDACNEWLAGKPVFAGCEAKPPPGGRRLPVAR